MSYEQIVKDSLDYSEKQYDAKKLIISNYIPLKDLNEILANYIKRTKDVKVLIIATEIGQKWNMYFMDFNYKDIPKTYKFEEISSDGIQTENLEDAVDIANYILYQFPEKNNQSYFEWFKSLFW